MAFELISEEISMSRFTRSFLSISILVLSGLAFSSVASAAHTRVTYPSVVSVEMLGRAMLWSINYDQVLNDNLSVGAGYGSVSTFLRGTDTDAGKSATFIPAYMNYYFIQDGNSPFVTAGVTLITNHASVKNFDTATGGLELPTSSVMPTFGGGFESRSDNQFLFRAAGYLIAGRRIAPWLGFSFGYAF
jgi:hypothetical protein